MPLWKTSVVSSPPSVRNNLPPSCGSLARYLLMSSLVWVLPASRKREDASVPRKTREAARLSVQHKGVRETTLLTPPAYINMVCRGARAFTVSCSKFHAPICQVRERVAQSVEQLTSMWSRTGKLVDEMVSKSGTRPRRGDGNPEPSPEREGVEA